MIKKILLLAAAFLTITISSVHANSSSVLGQLDDISDDSLQLAKVGKYSDSEKMLLFFSDRFIKGKKQIFNMDELRVITASHDEALTAIRDKRASASKKVDAVTKFRLVMDAVKSNRQPLWTSMEDPMMTAFSQTKEAVKEKDSKQFHNQISILLNQYSVIHPSLKVDLSKDTLEKLDARVNFIKQYEPGLLSDESGQKELDGLQQDLKSIFDDMSKDEADPSLWWVIITTGSIIILTLSYVGWRKYKGGEGTESPRKERND
ncbi:sporulation protein YpjB [Peribacillus sp. B-H-3]|uniref:sporulation protein YpjB n=1 Tax=Peribacillus sp. B-H-3 TaxID=3400420 RepID=UPI003B0178CC